ncbi:Cna B-type domain-containing protein [Erysipelotrichaceae bacterium Oil+RF-744-GAM-WT-6]|uniref:Cna B-type domain-containing protein n=1 Tax=Stecheria intestinalis TaxID=2606630 RepID=A0A7X2NRI9_9FIRM|nr:Cna B-type domain-containing protein [Stecheria intestinalis]MSS58240.1 Cna B-type domain-containing protein [Stecheria intestinalis]
MSGNAGIFTFNKAIDLNNQQLYIIVRTEPNANAFSTTQARPAATFINSLSMRNSSNESFTSVNSASMKIAQDGTNFKEVGEFGNYDASSKTWSGVTQVSGGNKPSDKILLSWATADGSTQYLSSGTYVDYRLVVNYAGNEEGTLRLEDVVPEGMEPVYVRYFWTAKYFWSTKKDDPSLQPEIAPITNLGDNWVDIGVKNAALDGNAGAATAGNLRKSAYGYYDSSTRTIKIEVSNLSRDTDSEDSVGTRDIQIQIVMRVTDPEVLKGTGKTFTNIMNVYSTAGSLVNSSSTETKIAVTDSITKNKSGSDISGTTLSTSNQLQTSFTMTVNPRGEDLLENSDTLTLVDSYSENLDINLSSLQVKESADSTENVSFTYQIDNSAHTLTLVIPDNKKLIISYDATIEAPLGTTIETISNEAYWYGYRSSKSKWSATKVKVEAAGSIDFGTTPIIKITKVDSQNALKTLEGAQFSLYETTYSETDKTFESTGNAVATETSNADGTVTFGASSSSYKLQFNKIYSIVETSAPTGYIRSSDPVYIGIFRTKTINNVTVYPKDMNNSTDSADVWNTSVLNDLASIANIYYTGTEYDYTWPNSRTSVRISKNFYDGTSNDPVTFPSGDFRFGLYYGGQLLQTLTISNANGQLTYLRTENGVTEAENQPLFTGLNTNDVYTIAELDDNGNQIANAASATINGETYTVTYPNDSTTFSTTGASVQTFSISNHTSVTISGTKTWDDNNNQDGKRPDHITVKLLADGNEVRSTVVNSSTSWAYSFNDLPKYRDGHEISYSVIEDAVPDYSTEITGYDITNSYTPGKTSVTVTKVWDDGNNQDGIRPESVQVQLYADGKASGDPVTLNSDGNWTYTWDNLDQMKSGTEIVYTAEEVTSIDGYTSSVSGNAAEGFTITNTHTPEIKRIVGTKTWDDNNNQDGKRPDHITVKLLADGNEVRSTVVNSSTSWAYSFNDLPKYRDGHEISYSVIEDAVPDYSTEITGYDITNSYTPGKTSVTVTKVWDDGNNQDGIRPESVQVQLYADGKASGDPVTLNSDGNWTYTWDNLDQMKSGTEIVYTAEEVTSIDGYTSSVSGNAAEGFTITNHHTPAEKTTVTEDTNSSGGDSSPSASTLNLVPDTADHTDVLRHGITAILSLTTALIAVVAYKRYQ